VTNAVFDDPRWRDFRGAVSVYLAGEPVIEEARGLEGRPADIALPACSVGKQFVASCAMLLAEEGRLDLHAPIGGHLDHLPEAWRALTTHQLLAHTSGLGHWDQVRDFDPCDLPSAEEVIARRATRPLISAPGTAFRYSSVGYILAARVIEHVSSRPYRDFASARIFRPLGMNATHIVPATIPGTDDVRTTVADLARYARAFGGDELLSRRSRELMCTPHAEVPAQAAEIDGTVGYGYGLYLGSFAGRAMSYHPGDIVGYRSAYVSVPSLGASIAVLGDGDGNDAVGLAARLLATVVVPGRGRWELWREDDNANRCLVSVHEDEASACARLAEFESGVVHKQRYWVTAV
jgi:CubicO group peptidase (beta-lactamase class C family)